MSEHFRYMCRVSTDYIKDTYLIYLLHRAAFKYKTSPTQPHSTPPPNKKKTFSSTYTYLGVGILCFENRIS